MTLTGFVGKQFSQTSLFENIIFKKNALNKSKID